MPARTVEMLIRARDEASPAFRLVTDQVSRLDSALGTLKRAVVGAVAGYGGLRIIRDSLSAWSESESAVKGLSDALKLLGADTKSQLPALEAFAVELQRTTTYSDELILRTMKLGATMGQMSGGTLQDATIAAIGLSKAYGIDLEAAMRLVSKAAQGQIDTLARYGIVLDDSMTTQEKFNIILGIGAKNFALATGEVETLRGQLSQLGNAWRDLKESIGKTLTDLGAGMQKSTQYTILILRAASTAVENYRLSWDIAKVSIHLALLDTYEVSQHILLVGFPRLFLDAKDAWLGPIKELGEAIRAEIVGALNDVVDQVGGIPDKLKQTIRQAVGQAGGVAGQIGEAAKRAADWGAMAPLPFAAPWERAEGAGQAAKRTWAEWFGGRPGTVERALLPLHGLDDPNWVAKHRGIIGDAKAMAGVGTIAMTWGATGALRALAFVTRYLGAGLAGEGAFEALADRRQTPQEREMVEGGAAGSINLARAYVMQLAANPQLSRITAATRAGKIGMGIAASAALLSRLREWWTKETYKRIVGEPQARAGNLRGTALYETGLATGGGTVTDVIDSVRDQVAKARDAVRNAAGRVGGRLMEGFRPSKQAEDLRAELARLIAEFKNLMGVGAQVRLPAMPPLWGGAGAGPGGIGGGLVPYEARFMVGAPGMALLPVQSAGGPGGGRAQAGGRIQPAQPGGQGRVVVQNLGIVTDVLTKIGQKLDDIKRNRVLLSVREIQ